MTIAFAAGDAYRSVRIVGVDAPIRTAQHADELPAAGDIEERAVRLP